MHRHVWDMLLVMEEGNHPLLKFTKCDMFVTWWELNGNHQATVMCARGAERWMKRLQDEEAGLSTTVAFEAYVRPLEMVTLFKYLSRIIRESDNDWSVVVTNLKRGRNVERDSLG